MAVDSTKRYRRASGFWEQSPDHQLAYAAHGVKAFMRQRAANGIVRPARFAIQRAMQDPIDKFDWGTWFTKNFYKKPVGKVVKKRADVASTGAFLALLPRVDDAQLLA